MSPLDLRWRACAAIVISVVVVAVSVSTVLSQSDGLPLKDVGDVGIIVQRRPMTLTIGVPLGVLGVQTVTISIELELTTGASYSESGILLSDVDVKSHVGDTGEVEAAVEFGGVASDTALLLFEVTPAPTNTPIPGPTPTPTLTPSPTPPLPPPPSCIDILNARAKMDADGFLEYRRNRVIGKWLVDWQGVVSDVDPRPPGVLRGGFSLIIDSLSQPCSVVVFFNSAEPLAAYSVGQRVSVSGQIEDMLLLLNTLAMYIDESTLELESVGLTHTSVPHLEK